MIAYSGDTEWTDALLEVADGADLFVCECQEYDRRIPGHLDYRTLSGAACAGRLPPADRHPPRRNDAGREPASSTSRRPRTGW